MSSLCVPNNLAETLAIHKGIKDGEIIVVGLTSQTGTDNGQSMGKMETIIKNPTTWIYSIFIDGRR